MTGRFLQVRPNPEVSFQKRMAVAWLVMSGKDRVKRYFRENWGAPFVIGFQILLLVCAGLLVRGDSALANEVAVYAYYLLVVGVVLQLASFMKYGERKGGEKAD